MRLFALLLFCISTLSAQNFDMLMGKETKHWSYLAQDEDRDFLAMCKAVYEKNVQELVAAKKNSKIPKTIHFIWLGPRPFPPESVENVRTWMAHHPDWTVKFWTDRDRPTPCRGMQKVFIKDAPFTRLQHCFVDSQNYGEKSDILRYEILYHEGGVYVDHDANCLQPFHDMHAAYDFYCGLEAPHEPFVARNITCGNGVIGSRPHHPVVRRVIELIDQRWEPLAKKFQGRDSYSRTEVVMQRTYIALTHVLNEGALNREGNVDIVLPAAYFFAKSGIPSLYSKHFYATAWAEDRVKSSDTEKSAQKQLSKIVHKSQTVFALTLLLIAANLLFVVMLYRKMRKHV